MDIDDDGKTTPPDMHDSSASKFRGLKEHVWTNSKPSSGTSLGHVARFLYPFDLALISSNDC